MEKKKVLYPCACQECKCGSKVAVEGAVCSLCRTGTHQKEIPEYRKPDSHGESKMKILENHGDAGMSIECDCKENICLHPRINNGVTECPNCGKKWQLKVEVTEVR